MPKDLTIRVNGQLTHVDSNIKVFEYIKLTSLERIMELGWDAPSDEENLEHLVIRSMMQQHLKEALESLSNEERELTGLQHLLSPKNKAFKERDVESSFEHFLWLRDSMKLNGI